jgi:hypothetical protein
MNPSMPLDPHVLFASVHCTECVLEYSDTVSLPSFSNSVYLPSSNLCTLLLPFSPAFMSGHKDNHFVTVLFNSLTATCSSYSDSANVIWNISIHYSFICSSRSKLDAILCELLPLFYRFIHVRHSTDPKQALYQCHNFICIYIIF